MAPGNYRLRCFVGTDLVSGSSRQVTRNAQAKTRRQAQQILDALRDDVVAAEPTGSTAAVSVAHREVAGALRSRGHAPKTLHEARQSAETVIFPALGDVLIIDLIPRHLDELYRRLRRAKGGPDRSNQPVSAGIMPVLSASLGQAVRWGWLDRNPPSGPNCRSWARPPSASPPPTRSAPSSPVPRRTATAGGCSSHSRC